MRGLLVILALFPALVGCDQVLGLDRFASQTTTTTVGTGGTGGAGGDAGGGGGPGGAGGEAGGGPSCPVAWARAMVGTAATDSAEVTALALDPTDGSVVTSGDFQGTVSVGDHELTAVGGQDLFLTKHTAAGELLWDRGFGGGGSGMQKRSKDLVVGSDGTIAWYGDYQGELSLGGANLPYVGIHRATYVAGFAPDLNHVWSEGYADAYHIVAKAMVAVDGGGYVVTGHAGGPVDFGDGPLPFGGTADIFVQGLLPDGQHLAAVQLGGPNEDLPWAIAREPSGNLWIAGMCGENFDALGHTKPGGGLQDACLIRLTATGTYLWHDVWGDDQWQEARAVAVMSNGVVVAGSFFGTMAFPPLTTLQAGQHRSIYVAKLLLSGDPEWAYSIACDELCMVHDVLVDDSDRVIVAASFGGTITVGGEPLTAAGEADSLVLWLTAGSGQLVRHLAFGSADLDRPTSIATDAASRLLVGGLFEGAMSLCSGDTLDAQQARGAYLLELHP